jgi:hypothetical protein
MARNDAGALTGTARSDRSRETLAPKGQSKGEACQYNTMHFHRKLDQNLGKKKSTYMMKLLRHSES